MCAYLGPLALLAEQVSVAVGLQPVLLEAVSPHQLPVAQVVDLPPLLLGPDTRQELLLALEGPPHTHTQ